MQTKLKPFFFLITLAAMAILLYAANDAGAQQPPKGLFNVPGFSPGVITISPKISRPAHNGISRDTAPVPLPATEPVFRTPQGIKQ